MDRPVHPTGSAHASQGCVIEFPAGIPDDDLRSTPFHRRDRVGQAVHDCYHRSFTIPVILKVIQ